jgi:hypothetical protein
VLLAAVNKSPVHIWNDVGIIEFWSIRHKPLLEGYLNANHSFWNSVVSNISVVKLLNLLHINESEISAPQSPIHYSPVGNSDILDTVVHRSHCLWHSGLRSPTNRFPLAGSY